MIRLDRPNVSHQPACPPTAKEYEDAEEIFYTYASKPDVTKYMSWPTHQSWKTPARFYGMRCQGGTKTLTIPFPFAWGRIIVDLRLWRGGNEEGELQFGYIFRCRTTGIRV